MESQTQAAEYKTQQKYKDSQKELTIEVNKQYETV